MSIRLKLLLGFLSVEFLITLGLFYTVYSANHIKQDVFTIVDTALPKLRALYGMQNASLKAELLINNFNQAIASATVNANTPTKVGATKDELLAYLEEITEWQKQYNLASGKHRDLNLTALTQLHNNVVIAALNEFNARETGALAADLKQKHVQLTKAQRELEIVIDNAVINQNFLLRQAQDAALKTANSLLKITVFLNLAIILVATIISLYLAYQITKPIISLNKFAQNINFNSLDNLIPATGKDEVGELAKSMNMMLSNLSDAKSQLIASSRQAGIAEVATSILHNVGNILNSVNVSTNVISEVMKNIKFTDLTEIVRLLQQNKQHLNDYVEKDDKGKLLLPYLEKYAHQLEEERVSLMEEVTRLGKNLQHIKNVIAMQQGLAKSNEVYEMVCVSEVVENSLSLYLNKIGNTGISIERYFANIPKVKTVKAKLEQILVNLIKNAIDSLTEATQLDKRLIIRIVKTDENMLLISISDNGLGIAPENMQKIFSFGFTTKKEGHGYGIHNCALLAKELNGKLTAESKGLGQGATFNLEIPS